MVLRGLAAPPAQQHQSPIHPCPCSAMSMAPSRRVGGRGASGARLLWKCRAARGLDLRSPRALSCVTRSPLSLPTTSVFWFGKKGRLKTRFMGECNCESGMRSLEMRAPKCCRRPITEMGTIRFLQIRLSPILYFFISQSKWLPKAICDL